MLGKKIISKHSNMLIIGKATVPANIGEISYETNYDDVVEKYGESDISRAFKIAQEYGCNDIFVMNLRTSFHYLDCTDLLKDYDFTYIVPVSVYVSDTMNDPYHNDIQYSYVTYLLSKISNSVNCNSVIVATDKHASLYETMDDFIDEMNFNVSYITDGSTNKMKLNNVIFVANNLKDTKYANVVLAASLCYAPLSQYPSGEYGDTVFDIDTWDGLKEVALFKPHTNNSTTVENLLNLQKEGATKIVYIDRIIKALQREIEFTEFIGKGYTEYRRLKIEEKLAKYLDTQIGVTIYDYNIDLVQGIIDRSNPGTVIVKCDFTVWPLNCITECHISKEIEL